MADWSAGIRSNQLKGEEMPARAAAKGKGNVKVLAFPTEPVVDSEFSTKHAEVQIVTGTSADMVRAKVDLTVYDRENSDGHLPNRVSILWELDRYRPAKGGFIYDHPTPHTEMLYREDEIEAFATALYKAVQLAKQRGYLPGGIAGGIDRKARRVRSA